MVQVLDSKKLMKKFHNFFDEHMRSQIREAIHSEKDTLHIDFFDISEYDIELGDQLLEYPQDVLKIMDETLKQFSEDDTSEHIKARLTSLPKTEHLMIRNIRSEHLGKLILLEGLVIRKTDVRPRLTHIEYLCTNPDCTYSQEKLRIPQIEEKAKKLKACVRCKAPIEIVNSVLVDSQNLLLGEIPEQLENSAAQPRRINVLLSEDLVSPFKDSRTNPGAKVYVIGMVKEIPKQTRTGADSVNYEIIVDGHYIDLSQKDYSEIKISKEEEEKIKELSRKDNVYEILTENFAPSIFGYDRVKEAILLQLFGGSPKEKADGVRVRGDIHVLLIGDPGAAKSQMLKAATRIAPKSSFVSGKSATGVGMVAAVVRDDLTKGWALEAGALVLASGGLASIDEMDKMSDDDTSAMHEALEQQTVSIAKANIQATLRCQTTVLGAANPKFGRFDPYGDIAKQIDFPPALLSRFDLIFVLRDIPDKKRDDLIADHILQTNKDTSKTITDLEPDFIKKFIAYAKENCNPVLTQEAITKIREFYVKIRSSGADDEDSGVKSVPITARQLEAIVRLSEAYAKIKLDDTIRVEYAQKAIDMIMYCLEKIGIDPKTGELDIDRITTGVTATTRNQYKTIIDIIDRLETEKPDISYDDICEQADKTNVPRKEVARILDKLKQEGMIYEPRKNIYKKLL